MGRIERSAARRAISDQRCVLEPRERDELVRALRAWYRGAARDLPWRRTRDPYTIWVSEVMLQQTRVAAALPYFERWMQRFPDVGALAAADDHDVLHAWQGLGYYSRARRLLAGARTVVAQHAGTIPDTEAGLRALPGVGPYTAAAIASIAFDRRAAVVDANVERVLCRLLGLRGDPGRAPLRRALWRLAQELAPPRGAAIVNQAWMELGATLCTPRQPRCDACPLGSRCRARAAGLSDRLPEKAPRPAPQPLGMVAAVVERRGRVLVTRLPDDAPRWAGMWAFPTVELAPGEAPRRAAMRAVRAAAGIGARPGGLLAVVRHSVTRHRITLEVYRCTPQPGGTIRRTAAWVTRDALDGLALPAAHRRIALALAQ